MTDDPWLSFAERSELERAAGRERLKHHVSAAARAKALGLDERTAIEAEAFKVAEELKQENLRAQSLKAGDPGVVIDGRAVDGGAGWPMPTLSNPEALQEAYERDVAAQQAVGPGVHKQDAMLVPPAPLSGKRTATQLDKLIGKK